MANPLNTAITDFAIQLLASTGLYEIISNPTNNLSANGLYTTGTAGQTLAFGDPCYVDSTGKIQKADSEFGGPLATHLSLGVYTINQTCQLLEFGYIRNDSWNWAALGSNDGIIYLSDTATLTQTAPSSSTSAKQILGYAATSKIIFFNPLSLSITPLGSTMTQLTSAAAGRTALDVPSTAGSGATGTWGINISGNAATVTTNANLTGDVTSVGNATTLPTLGAFAGTYGSASQSSQVTVNNKGQVTNATNVTITPSAIGAPTTSGTGATGTWGINISGNAATATSATTAGSATTATTATNVSGGTASVTTLSASGQVSFTSRIIFNGAPATLTASGFGANYIAAETVAFGQLGYITTAGTIGKADMDVAVKSPARCLILGTATVGQPVDVLYFGHVTLSTWTWTPGEANVIWLSTAGAMSQAPTWITDSKEQRIAVPLTATTILFSPSMDYTTHV